MMEYSNSIPKPPISIPKPSLKNNQGISASAPELSSTGAARQVLANGDQVPSFMSELEKKYHESLSKVDEIRRQHRRMVLSAE
jgi:hypothetical protein